MLRLINLDNKFIRRNLRALYGQTQAYPYDAQLDPNFDRTAGALSGGTAISGAKSAIIPGQVAKKLAGEVVSVSGSWSASARPFGLFASYVGGDLGTFEVPTGFDRVGVWRGAGGVFELLTPVFDTTNLSTDSAAEDGTAAKEVYLSSNSKGQLSDAGAGAFVVNTAARLVRYISANAIVVELLV